MFRFTIRELALVTVIAATGVAWWLDRRDVERKGNVRAAAIRSHAEVLRAALKKAKPVTMPVTHSYSSPLDSHSPDAFRRRSASYLPQNRAAALDWSLADKPIPP